jgi:hypothetical protein
MTDFDPGEARTSEWALCPRCCACRVAGLEGREPDERMERYFRRGQLFELYVVQQFVEKYGAADVERQRDIVWPLGTGHADIYIPSEKLLVEVFSTTGGNIDRKIKQVKLYLYFDGEAEKAVVYVVDPSTLEREDIFPVTLTDEDRAEIAAELDALLAVQGGADPPPCVFSSPTECRFAGCAFTEAAWADWQDTTVETDEFLPLVNDLNDVNKSLRDAEKEVAIRREQAAYLKDALARAGLEAGRDYIIGPYKVRRTVVGPRHTFSLSTARKAGFELPAELLPFVKVGEGHERFSVKEAAA